MQRSPWGGSTNLIAAFKLIIEVIKVSNIPPEDVPDLLIVSDMQFDAAVGQGSQTTLEHIQKMFADLSRETSVEYPTPRIIFWNVRADTTGYPASSSSTGVQMLSGYSPSLMESVMSGKAMATPYDTLREVLDHDRYDKVREVLSASDEGLLANYVFRKTAA